MIELFAALLACLLAVGFWAVTGHLLWLLASALGRFARGSSRAAEKHCPRCQALLVGGANCSACAWPFPPRVDRSAPSAQGLRTLRAFTEKLSQSGAIDATALAQLCSVIDDNEQRLSATVAAVPPLTAEIPLATLQPMAELPREPAVPVAEHVAPPSVAATESSLPTLPPVLDLAARARHYGARRAAAAETSKTEPSPAAPKSKPLAQLLSAFLEEKNIRWGELAGGLLIVGCSIALVISFWAQIAQRPFLKFVVFGGVTASVFAAGLYTERRWKLPTTSRGLYLIGALLVPLNFLAIAALERGSAAPPAWMIIGELLTIGLFGCLLLLAGKNLSPDGPVWLAAGVLVPSALQLVTRRFVGPDASPGLLWALAGSLTVPYVTAGVVAARSRSTEDANRAAGSLRLLGVTSFALLVALGLLLVKTERPAETLRLLAPAATLLAAPAWLIGLRLWKGARQGNLATFGVTGAALAVAAAGVSFAGMAGSWPSPVEMIAASLASAGLMVMAAVSVGIAAAWLPACLCGTWAFLLIAHLARGSLPIAATAAVLRNVLLSAETGNLLFAPVLLLAGGALFGRRKSHGEAAQWIERAGLGLATVSAALIGWFGLGRPGDPHGATWSLLAYAVLAGAAAIRLDRAPLAVAAAVLGSIAAAQGCVFGLGLAWQLEHPWTVAALLSASACAGVAMAMRTVAKQATAAFAGFAQAALVVASPLVAGVFMLDSAVAAWPLAAWATVVWLALGIVRNERPAFVAGQTALVATVVLAVGALLERQAWFEQAAWPWLDPWTLEAVGVALAGLALTWQGLRYTLRKSTFARLLAAAPLDAALHAPLTVLMLALAVYAVLPTAAQELTPRLAAQALGAVGEGRLVPPLARFELVNMPVAHVNGWGGWTLAFIVSAVCLAQWLEKRTRSNFATLVLAAWSFCLWGAAFAVPMVATASALRWLSAAFVLLVALAEWRRSNSRDAVRSSTAWRLSLALCTLAWSLMGLYVAGMAVAYQPLPTDVWESLSLAFGFAAALGAVGAGLYSIAKKSTAGAMTGALGALPFVATLIYALTVALRGNPIAGPDPSSWFGQLGLAVSYTGPIVLVALALLSEAVRRRSEGYAFAAGALVNISATAGYLLALRGQAPFDAVLWTQLVQLNALVAAVFGLGWLAAERWSARKDDETPAAGLLDAQLRLGAALFGIALATLAVSLWLNPVPGSAHLEAASAAGWLSFAVAAAALVLAEFRRSRLALSRSTFSSQQALLGVLLLCMAANTLARWDHGQWLSYHTLMIGWLAISATLLALIGRRFGKPEAMLSVAGGASLLALAFAVRGLNGDPQWPWWSAATFVVCALQAAWWGAQVARRTPLCLSALLVNSAASVVWWKLKTPGSPTELLELILVNVMAFALPAAAWLALELRCIRPRRTSGDWGWGLHLAAASTALVALVAIAARGLWLDSIGDAQPFPAAYVLLAWLATALASLSCLWDERARWSTLGVYLLGLTGLALLLDSFNLTSDRLIWTGAMFAAAYSVGTSYLWSRRAGLQKLAQALHVPTVPAPLEWIVPATAVLGVAAAALSFLAVITFDDPKLRISAAQAILAQGLAFGFLAQSRERRTLILASLAAVAIGCVAFSWALIDPALPAAWLHRGVASLLALGLVAAAYGLGLTKLLERSRDWAEGAQQLTPWLIGGAGIALVRVLGTEVWCFFDGTPIPLEPWAIAAVLTALVGLTITSLAAALLPGRDPLALSERGRTIYVYAAEALLALACLHVRLTMPWLFSGFWRAWWPFLAMLVAFAGVGLSELFRRLRRPVLAEPLERTAMFLPLLPLLGFWVEPGQGHFSFLLLSVSGLYAVLALLRSSLGFGVVALVAAQGGLWYFLGNDAGLRRVEHPQVWLIPPAICTLIGAYLNRSRLTAEQMTQIRYLASTVIYASSTAEMFINGVAQAPWLPLVLAGLSLAGLFAGILLHVRAFLYLGATFLTVALMSIIWHAAHDLDQTWIWYATGIVVGALIIALFATFEKKRHEVLNLIDQVRSWEG